MAQPATSSNVLRTLDDRVPTSFYWQLTLLATLGGFLPETKGLPVEEIVQIFEHHPAAPAAAQAEEAYRQGQSAALSRCLTGAGPRPGSGCWSIADPTG
jgi:hypothetical protein